MRPFIISSAALALALGCAHEPSNTARTTESSGTTAGGDLVASPSTGADAETVSACGESQVFFASGSSDLDALARSRLDTYAGCLSRQEIDTIYVSGMTDRDGSAADNVVLGRARAQSVADYLESVGCDVHFVIRSYGEVGAVESEPLWPIERSAAATGVTTP